MKQALDQLDIPTKEILLFPGISLHFYSTSFKQISVTHPKWKDHIAINYCCKGRICWEMENKKHIYLGPSDFSIHTLDLCSSSKISFPTESYEGICLCIDRKEVQPQNIPILWDSTFSLASLVAKFCSNDTISSFAGNTYVDMLFHGFYQDDTANGFAMQRIKCIELLLFLQQMPVENYKCPTPNQSDLVEIVHKIHSQLTKDMGKRYTIEELSRQYAINPTTLKSVFKSVYGNSLAAHIKEHRMEYAAKLLRETEESIALISKKTGYESQSKFTTAFKANFHMLPREYRKLTKT